MVATLKTGVIQEPSSATVNLTLDASGGVAVGQNLTVAGTTTFTGGSTFTGNATAAAFVPSGSTVPTNGLFLPAANSAGIATNSIERLRIDSSGNVGIGTTSPSYRLDVISSGGTQTARFRSGDTATSVDIASFERSDSAVRAVINYNSSDGAMTYGTSTNHPIAFDTNNTERMRITSNGGVSFGSSGTAYGTSGQYLKSNGDAVPTWSTLSASGGLIRAPRVLTSGTSYTTPAGCNNILIEMIGAGGGGGGCAGINTGAARGGGGGNALYAVKYVAVTPSTAYTYAIGAGGTAATGANGGAGGTTSITIGATTYSCSGGGGGLYGASASQGAVGATGTATNMDSSITTLIPASAYIGGSVTTPYGTNYGGMLDAFFNSPVSGNPARSFGAGGGGAYNGGSYTFQFSGGVGYQGVIRIWEYT